jgi:hypothetical protein
MGIYEHGDEPLDTIKGKIISQEGRCLMKVVFEDQEVCKVNTLKNVVL